MLGRGSLGARPPKAPGTTWSSQEQLPQSSGWGKGLLSKLNHSRPAGLGRGLPEKAGGGGGPGGTVRYRLPPLGSGEISRLWGPPS